MSYNHQTVGFEAFDTFIQALELLDVETKQWELPFKVYDVGYEQETKHLRAATFTHPKSNRKMVVEEYLLIEDQDCDGTSRVAIEVYEDCHRPNLEARRQVIESR
jgi:hypothetical protein